MYILEDLILPKNQKIKAIRKYLKINQQELVGDKIDRSLISYIENGKTKLTRDTSYVIAQNLSKIIEQKKLNFKVSAEYIFADEYQQVGFLLDSYIDRLGKYKNSDDEQFTNELESIEDMFKKWDLPLKKAKVYGIAGDYFYEKTLIDESKIYYFKALENYSILSDYGNMADVNSKIARCAVRKNNYEEAAYLNMHVLYMLEINKINDSKLEKRVMFNNALANIKLKRYEIGMEMLDRLEAIFIEDERPQYTELLIMKANIYIERLEYQKALESYEQVLDISKSSGNRESESMVYNNLGYVYDVLEKLEKSIYYYTESLHIREEINSRFILLTLVSLAEMHFKNNENDIGQEYLLRVTEMLKSEKDISIKYKVYNNLLKIYSNTDYIKMAPNMCNDIIEFTKQNRKEYEDQELILKLCKYYAIHDLEKVKNILEIAL